jgi:Predicted membrane protein
MSGTGDSSKKIVWLYLIAAIVSLIGLGDAIYLTIQDITGESLRCTIISGCSEVLSSKYAHVGPIPLAAIGAFAYFVFFSLAVLAAFGYGFLCAHYFSSLLVSCFCDALAVVPASVRDSTLLSVLPAFRSRDHHSDSARDNGFAVESSDEFLKPPDTIQVRHGRSRN